MCFDKWNGKSTLFAVLAGKSNFQCVTWNSAINNKQECPFIRGKSTEKLPKLESTIKHCFNYDSTLVTRESTNGQASTNLIVFLGRFDLQIAILFCCCKASSVSHKSQK